MELENAIKALADKAKDTHDSADAIRFAQAALNLANTASIMKTLGQERK